MGKKNWDKIFEREFMPHADALQTFAYHLTYDEADAEDLVQETFLRAYKSIDKYEKGTNAKAWLFKILKNGFINNYRRRVKQPNKVDYEEIVAFQDEDDSSPLTSYVDLREELFSHLLGDEVTKALDELAEEFRTVILLADVEEFTYEEVSKILDIPLGTVRSRLFRARNLLKEKLKTYAESFGYEDKRN